MAVVYLHKRKDNKEVFYVGIGKTIRRAYSKQSRSTFWHRYTSKHEYFIEVLIEGIDWEEACEIEKELICFYGRRDLGFGELLNLTDGGEGRVNFSLSQEAKDKIGLAHKGNKYWLGKKHSVETRNRISKSKVGKVMSEDTKKKISKANLGNKHMLGKVMPLETKTKMSKPVLQFTCENVFISEYFGVREAAKISSIDRSSIIRSCTGRQITAGGYIWKYKN